MVVSMTGYGAAEKESKGLKLEIAVRTVNGRYLDIRLHMPKEYTEFEIELKKKISQTIKRGTVDIFVHRRLNMEEQNSSVAIRKKLLQSYYKAHEEVAKQLKLELGVTSHALLKLPEVTSVVTDNKVKGSEKKQVLQTLGLALGALGKTRLKEGAGLEKELKTLLGKLKALVKKVSAMSRKFKPQFEKRLTEKLAGLSEKRDWDEGRMSQEILYLIEKADVREEVVRLQDHIESCEALLKSKGIKGKKLDFYTQELLRETNTIGSKSQFSDLTQLVVDAKSIIESFREQVQNVE